MKRRFAKLLTNSIGVASVAAAALFVGANSEWDAFATKTVNVVDYGAVANDSQDDVDAIQECLDMALETNEDLVVNIPAGKFNLRKPLIVYSNTTLKLTANTTMYRQNEEARFLASDTSNQKGKYGQAQNITIDGGVWDGKITTTNKKSEFMRFNHAKNITLKNATLKDVCSKHIVVFAGVDGVTVDNVKFQDQKAYTGKDDGDNSFYESSGKDGKIDYFQSMRTAEALHIDCIDKKGAAESAQPLDGTVCKNVKITNCEFTNLLSGLGSHYTDLKSEGSSYIISNNKFTNVRFECIDMYGHTGVQIEKNTATNVGEFIRVCTSDVKKLNDNTIKINNKKDSVIDAKKENELNGILVFNKSKVTEMSGNTITNARVHGISITEKASVALAKNNVITTPGEKGINVSAANAVLKSNTITKSNEHAIAYNKKSTGEVSGNKIANPKDRGISIIDSTITDIAGNTVSAATMSVAILDGSKVTGEVKNNKIAAPKDTGIYVSASEAKLVNNTINNAKKNGIYILNKSDAAKIAGNTVNGCSQDSIKVNLSRAIVKENTIENAKTNAIVFYKATGGSIVGNKIKTPGKSGIVINDNTKIKEINDNVITSPKLIGIAAYTKSKVTAGINGNTIINAPQHGIYLSGSIADVTKNTIKNCRKNGLFFAGNAKSDNVVGNVIETPKECGIYVTESFAYISKNTIKTPGISGIVFNKAKGGIVTQNTVTKPAKKGVNVIVGSKVNVINNNKIENPGEEGINVTTKSTVTKAISGNTITNPGKVGIYLKESKGNIKNNTVTNGKAQGIYVSNYQSMITIEGNTVKDCKTDGIYAGDCLAAVNKNKIINPGKRGIVVYNIKNKQASACTANWNTITNAKDAGIQVNSVNRYNVSNNTVTGSKGFGIQITKSTLVQVQGNKVSGGKTKDMNVGGGSTGFAKGNKFSKNGFWVYDVKKFKCSGNKTV